MCKNTQAASPSRGAFNTLAQSGTDIAQKPAAIVQGNGSDLTNVKALKGRAQRKGITQVTMLSLIDVAANNGENERIKPYWNTYYCQTNVKTANGKLYGKYCKNRFCTLCSSIRKADIINRYLPVIKTWPEPWFVTLTVKAYNFKSLPLMIKKVMQGFNKIKSKHRKRNQRGNGLKLMGVRSLECNFNPKTKTYNPHLHLIVPDKQTAELFISEWLTLWGRKFASPLGQKAKKVFDNEIALIEVIKYGSKIFTEPDVNSKIRGANNGNIHAAALNHIFKGMQGFRLFERFGFNLPVPGRTTNGARVTNEYEEWVFELPYFDWFNQTDGKRLSDYQPTPQLTDLLENRIDKELW